MRVRVEAERCVGHGRCYALAPDVYAPDDEGHCIVLLAEPPAALEAAARTGADNCPEGAIVVEA